MSNPPYASRRDYLLGNPKVIRRKVLLRRLIKAGLLKPMTKAEMRQELIKVVRSAAVQIMPPVESLSITATHKPKLTRFKAYAAAR